MYGNRPGILRYFAKAYYVRKAYVGVDIRWYVPILPENRPDRPRLSWAEFAEVSTATCLLFLLKSANIICRMIDVFHNSGVHIASRDLLQLQHWSTSDLDRTPPLHRAPLQYFVDLWRVTCGSPAAEPLATKSHPTGHADSPHLDFPASSPKLGLAGHSQPQPQSQRQAVAALPSRLSSQWPLALFPLSYLMNNGLASAALDSL